MDQSDDQPPPFEVAEGARIPEPPPTSTPKRAPAPRDEGGAHVKETLESIVVAFILAFIFRCFIVEAFVIPTGSMAPTLMGAHTRHQCPDCGYRFDVNFSTSRGHGSSSSEEEIDIPSHAGPEPTEDRDPKTFQPITRLANVNYTDLRCPNCGYLLPKEVNPPVFYGDRILVLKYIYLLHDPRRWDVVVFKSPDDPQSKDYSINYIKRLTGLPGETIMVLDGDIYVKPKGKTEFELQRKTAAAQEALWRVVYDDDHRPSGQQKRGVPWRQPWEQVEGKGWSDQLATGERGMAFDNATGGAKLQFDAHPERGGDREGAGNYGFRDWLAYDQHHPLHNDQPPAYEGNYPVSDLKLSLYYTRSAGEGPLRLTLTKQDHAFTAEVLPDHVVLHHLLSGKPTGEDRAAPLASRPAGEPMKIDFTNVDYRVTVRIDGKDVLSTTDEEYHPDLPDLRKRVDQYEALLDVSRSRAAGTKDAPLPAPTVSIQAERQRCELRHVGLWRDVYYTQRDAGNNLIHWASPRERPFAEGGPIALGDDEFFVMGDNSPSSYDARYWMHEIHLPGESLDVKSGRVPGRFMLGRAFFVYWPAGFRPTDKMPGVVPNFGEMRFIR